MFPINKYMSVQELRSTSKLSGTPIPIHKKVQFGLTEVRFGPVRLSLVFLNPVSSREFVGMLQVEYCKNVFKSGGAR